MVCLYCGSKTQVINSRPVRRINQTWRRRECQGCRAIFTTRETIDYAGAIVVQQDSSLEAFDRDTLFLSLAKSLGHRNSAVPDATALTITITQALLKTAKEGFVKVTDIAATAHSVLLRFDRLAADHYHAYHLAVIG